jgi:hypothetical protein
MCDQITKNETGRVSGTYGGEEKCIWDFGEETPEGKSSLGGPRCRVGRIKWIFKEWGGGMDWIDLVHDRDRWCGTY